MANAPGQGRKPTPTALRVLRGNPGKRPLNSREPKPRNGLPPPPAHLDDEAKREWRRMGKELVNLGILTVVDKAAFAAYCVAWSRWAQAEAMVKQAGVYVPTLRGWVKNPMVAVADTALAQMLRAAVEFGMTPSSRTRVQAAPQKPDEDEFAEFERGSRRTS